MSVLKTILSSVLWALLVLFIPIFGLETVSQSSLGIGLFKFFILALISLFCFSGLITSIESALLRRYRLKLLFYLSLLLGLIPVIIQIFVAGSISARPLTTAIYWLAGISVVLALIPYVAGGCFSKIGNDNAARVLSAFLVFLCMAIPAFLSLSFFSYYLVSGSVLSADTLLAIAQTNNNEAFAYLKENMTVGSSLLFVVAALFIFCLVILLAKSVVTQQTDHGTTNKETRSYTDAKKLRIRLFGTAFISLLAIVISSILISKTSHNLITKPFIGLAEGLKLYKDFKDASLERIHKFGTLAIEKDGYKGLYILVIGESQNRNHMSAYGYKRETTPWLSKMKNDPNAVIFSNAYSNHTHTVPALTYALTSKSQYDDNLLQDCPSLIELANASGYETYWISNQVKLSAWDTPVTLIASTADHQMFINTNFGTDTGTTFYDGELVNSLKNLHSNSDRILIVLHLMGNHTVYEERYPGSFKKFGRTSIDKYDNSMLYNDAVVKDIYEWAKKQPNFMSLTYVADHSEGVDRGVSHDSSQFGWDLTEIPFWMVFSDKYAKDHSSVVRNLKKNSYKPITNDMLFDTMSSVLGIESKFKNDNNDISSESYGCTMNELKTLHGRKSFEERKE
ncbi:phosphoethanolamine transferase [uncultured Parasutterella sp.]|uniref:phosphoethanolamine transferase n=1 Tax=uncultured Parasutterella sp. TaxID=1263098 RepID=UPI002593F5E2|nr:phosphoethanolamine transferase [uncultured Parasutterella sp.]